MIPLPTSFQIIKKDERNAQFILAGLYPGYGVTLGNMLRRVLLSSLEGAAVTEVKIKGAQHEFSVLPGVLEDIINICLNLKKLRFKIYTDEPVKVTLKAKGKKEVQAKDFEIPSQLELVNEEEHIATLTDKNASLEMEITVQKGVGYEPVEMRKKEKLSVGEIQLDAVYTPIKRVSYKVENMRVGERTDFDRLIIEVETDGTIKPTEAFQKAIDIILDHFNFIKDNFASKGKISIEKTKEEKKESKAEDEDILKTPIENLKLSTRTINALTKAHIKTLGGLIKKKEDDLKNLEGLGDKAIEEIKKVLKKYGLELK
ncbi:DNA-directed RNA polymerase subunit alpha [bacterium]|nr:DNA-directed RNA polymerase subunit alpha [bacterium]